MFLNSNKVLITIGILGFLASAYMIVSNVFLNGAYSIVAIIAGLVSPLIIVLTLDKNKRK